MVLGGLRTSPYLLDRVQPFMADNVFALAAALTWMAGSMLSSWGAAAEALRLFGGAAVFGVLLEGSWSSVWTGISGNWTLWILFFVILAIDAVLLTRMGIKRDRLAALGGLTPFIMLVAASLAVLKQPVCLLPSLYPSLPLSCRGSYRERVPERFQPAEMGRRMSSGRGRCCACP